MLSGLIKTILLRIPLLIIFIATVSVARENKSTVVKSTWEGTDTTMFQVGEELTYNVSYAFLDIGQVRIKIVDKINENGKAMYSAIAYIDSYKGVPFVDLHTIYETKISPPLCSDWFRARTKDENKWWHITYEMDYPKRSMDIKQGEYGTDKIHKQQSVVLDTFFQDGLSLFFFARSRVRYKHTVTVPTIIQEQKVSTFLNFMNEHTTEEIDAVDYPIDVVHFDGRADFVGIFGMTGEFEGWFSNDEARVPILAKMKVLIGNVRIELMKWKRVGWNPPRGEDD